MDDNKTNINWYNPTYEKPLSNPLFIRKKQLFLIAFFYKKNHKNGVITTYEKLLFLAKELIK